MEKLEALAHATAMLASVFPSVSDSEFRLSNLWMECHMLLPQVQAVLSRCNAADLDIPSDFIPVMCACGRYLLERRSFDDAESMFIAAKQACKAHGLQNWEQAQFVQRSLAGIILESSVFRCDEAINILQDVVDHYQKSRDPNDPVLGVTYSDLAQAFTARGDFDQGISLCEKALDIVTKIEDKGKRRDTLFHVHHNMGRIYEMKGIPDEALRLHLFEGDPHGNGLRQEQSVYGAWNLYAVGNCLQLQKDPRAIETHAKALQIREDLLGDHYFTAMSYHKLGELYLEGQSFHEASDAFEKAHDILEIPSAKTKAELARTAWYWSSAKEGMHDVFEARKLRDKAICIGTELLRPRKVEKWVDKEFDNLVVYYNR
ncbi:hypothetical protein J7337_007350 [Fusarium musae]|uniref:MalT-like TPR region domain-containing protein n=1 Tax=Fusarium musae TaxID=1042133 RepID=A0A9P8DGU6_9HYPO|nr:hypothetical protein J7337_007350 [Fusarium musae]KAG9501659.1 hypothetical protein J7337_007350 [Fusarium musae]